jgi:hypothetical protein
MHASVGIYPSFSRNPKPLSGFLALETRNPALPYPLGNCRMTLEAVKSRKNRDSISTTLGLVFWFS